MKNRQILLAARPGASFPGPEHFSLVERELAPLCENEVLVQNEYLSLDPYMRGRMSDAKSYAPPHPVGEVMLGGTVGTVLESRSDRFSAGDSVLGMGGWQELSVFDASQKGALQKVDASRVPLSAYLGVAGMPGVTAWYGLHKILEAKAGQTVAVSAASGAVGGVVGQLAKGLGCRVVGFAGGPEKCAYVVDELGFDACVDYKQHEDARSLASALEGVTPDGVHGYFENVGGVTLDVVLARMNAFGRVAMCGMIAGYNGEPIPLKNPGVILTSRLRVEGFIVSEHREHWATAVGELAGLVAAGKLKFRESVARGIESAPEAFFGLLKGKNFGKQLVKLR